jgi:hypothetical protein
VASVRAQLPLRVVSVSGNTIDQLMFLTRSSIFVNCFTEADPNPPDLDHGGRKVYRRCLQLEFFKFWHPKVSVQFIDELTFPLKLYFCRFPEFSGAKHSSLS